MSKNVPTFGVHMSVKELSKTKARELKALASKKIRDERGLFIVEGEKGVYDSLKAFELEALICTKKWLDNHKEFVGNNEEKIYVSDQRGIEIISSMKSLPEVIAVFKKPEMEEEIPRLDPDKLYVLLDEIQDPGNLGTIIRTCDWFGVYDIYASINTADAFSPKVVQSSMGSLSRVRLHYLDLESLVNKNKDLSLIGTLLDGVPLSESDISCKGMLLLGNEGRGISERLKKMIDRAITIPASNPLCHPDSLNVAIAGAIVLSYLKMRI